MRRFSSSLLAFALTASYHGFIRSAKGGIATFRVTGGFNTYPASINTAGAICGSYLDAQGVTHGFIRNAAGTIRPFDSPGSTNTYGEGINANGLIAGYYKDAGDIAHGFVLSR